ncbi:hypothetical protein [Nocardioides campestrisoli]|uniref:hypothetical protein n=1 Tax=Nocardioides campestrisoli TaxID=2736757 RepID=UPI0015E6D03E|nr:hypothetical protein [Nocardioides campestrisoli]
MSTEEDATLSVAAQLIADEETVHDATVSGTRSGIHLELVDLSTTPPADDDWDLDPTADLGLKIMIGGIDPEVAGQLLRIAADFLDEATIEDDEDED